MRRYGSERKIRNSDEEMIKFNREEVVTMSGNGGTEPQQGDNFTDDSIMGSWGE